MAGFDAGQAVEPLDYDLAKYAGPEAKGTIPEPTQAALDRFTTDAEKLQAGWAKAQAEVDGDMPKAAEKRLMGQMLTLLATFCQGSPSKEQIATLPPRVMLAFFQWLGDELGDGGDESRPTPADTNGSRATKTPV